MLGGGDVEGRVEGESTAMRPAWLRRLLVPRDSHPPPVVWLLYLLFLFMPLTWNEGGWRWLWPTLASLPLFLAVYVRHLRPGAQVTLAQVLSFALLSYALEPFNPFANTYLTYAAAFATFALPGLARPLLLTAVLLAVQALEVLLLRQPVPLIAISGLICVVSCLGNVFGLANRRKNEALRLSQEEVRRLAAVAERERIGRDLHDLLGHTLSLVALKGELAGRLVARDPAAATREIAEVTEIAREALTQVRAAVSGMRAAALASELLSARALLESSGVELTWRQEAAALPPSVETALAMIVREAATNIQRHARATHASVEISADGARGDAVALRVSDNGRGGIAARGNGLTGISERVRALGGTLEIDSPPGAGTVLRARLPVAS
jgi:two-component system, NarL family, sensor histidine kinase DesK